MKAVCWMGTGKLETLNVPDADAKKQIHNLIEEIVFESDDLGSLAVGGRLRQLGGPLAGIRLTFHERPSL
jgi:8-hydroxy-5-deazaflavin:NADPH oxidoreductase